MNLTGALAVDKSNNAVIGGGYKNGFDASTGVKAGGLYTNHNQTQVRAR